MKVTKKHKGEASTCNSGNYISEEVKEIDRLQHESRDTKATLEVSKK